ncbi:aldose epimerase family protein [Deinococcus sonorensis]|uniref:Aldose 1-epimerase n=2 Tax=Deinococcus sonorensis TaxID=309891 RepID=A0AAU7UGD6_9DEIO
MTQSTPTLPVARPWGQTDDGTPVTLYTLRAGQLEVQITDYGGRLVSVRAPDRQGQLDEVSLGSNDLEPYLHHPEARYFGALIGRYGNRIADGRFELDGQSVQLELNNPPNALHGGSGGFHARVWNATPGLSAEGPTLRLQRRSEDGEDGYPGALDVEVTYTVTADNALHIAYRASAEAPTVLNLTNHTYWNLSGAQLDSILDHTLQLESDRYTPVSAVLIPTGELAEVDGTPMDFRTPHTLGERIDAPFDQLQHAGGYDHNFVLRGQDGTLQPAAVLHDPRSGRVMTVETTEPGMQVYSGNFQDGSLSGYHQRPYAYRTAVCLETQHYPDSPNQPQFPSTRLDPGQAWTSHTVYRFSTQD